MAAELGARTGGDFRVRVPAAENGYPVTDFAKAGAAQWSITVQKA